MANFPKNRPSIDIGWCTIYLEADSVTVAVNINKPAEVESHHHRNPNHSFKVAEATWIQVCLPKPQARRAESKVAATGPWLGGNHESSQYRRIE